MSGPDPASTRASVTEAGSRRKHFVVSVEIEGAEILRLLPPCFPGAHGLSTIREGAAETLLFIKVLIWWARQGSNL